MRIRKEITPIHPLILVVSILLVYKMIQGGWTPVYFLIIGAAILDFGLLLLANYLLIRNLKMKYVWIIELFIIILLFFVQMYNGLSLFEMILLIY